MGNSTRNTPDGNFISSPTQVPGTTWDDITCFYQHFVAHKSDNTLWAWGQGGTGKDGLSVPANTQYSSPTQIPGSWDQGLDGHNPVFGWKA